MSTYIDRLSELMGHWAQRDCVGEGESAPAVLYRSYCAWHAGGAGGALRRGEVPSRRAFGLAMRSLGCERRKTNGCWLYVGISLRSPGGGAEPARPAAPGKAPQHFPELDRQPETAVIYAMPKSNQPKRGRGRPEMPGRRVVVKLEEELIKRAEQIGGGKVTVGIRKALSSRQR